MAVHRVERLPVVADAQSLRLAGAERSAQGGMFDLAFQALAFFLK